jgi:iron complex outermembrane receptor protein
LTGTIYGGLKDVYSLTTTSYAGFAQADYALSDKLKLIGGIRYTRDIKQFSFTESYPGYFYAFNRDTVGDLTHANTGFWTGKAELDYQVNPVTMVYGSYNVGVKAGGFNAPLDAGPDPDNSKIPFKPERLVDYEVGLKSELFERRLRLNLSGFYYDYHDYQALELISLTQYVSNKPARYYGGEAELRYVPDASWTIGANLSYSHGVVEDVDLNGTGARDYRPTNAPRWSGNAMVQHNDTLKSGTLSEQIDGSFVTKQYFALTDAPDTAQKAYALFNARLNFTTSNKKWELGAAVENFANKHYATMIFDLASFLGFAQVYPGRPRWWSVTAAYHF